MEALAQTFKALADPTRLEILALLLRHGELCVCDVERVLEITQSKSSRHLRYLEQSGLLESRRDAQWVYYRVEPKPGSDGEAVLGTLDRLLTPKRLRDLDRRARALATRRGYAALPGCNQPPRTTRKEP